VGLIIRPSCSITLTPVMCERFSSARGPRGRPQARPDSTRCARTPFEGRGPLLTTAPCMGAWPTGCDPLSTIALILSPALALRHHPQGLLPRSRDTGFISARPRRRQEHLLVAMEDLPEPGVSAIIQKDPLCRAVVGIRQDSTGAGNSAEKTPSECHPAEAVRRRATPRQEIHPEPCGPRGPRCRG